MLITSDLIDAYASLPHYAAHVTPVWEALPKGRRGEFYALRGDAPWATAPLPGRTTMGEKRLTVVASFTDAHKFAHRPCVLVEHGAGQAYPGDPAAARNPSYAGGDGLSNVVLFVSPRAEVAERWRARYPDARTAVVGCPRLDEWHRTPETFRNASARAVALTWHWEAELIPETRSAWRHYANSLLVFKGAAKAEGLALIGHAHPRMWGGVRRAYEAAGIPMVDSLDDVFTRAQVLIGDNTSALPEFASLDRPVIFLNAPWYRRNVSHGGRFWDWPRGQAQADGPGDIAGALTVALADPPQVAEARREMVRSVYAYSDGFAASRAAAAVLDVAG